MKKLIKKLLFFAFLSAFFLDFNSVQAESDLVPVYSFWNTKYSHRYLTISESEKKTLDSNSAWKKEGSPWHAFSTKKEDNVPIYKIKNEKYSYYFYTSSESIKNTLSKSRGWSYKGIAFHAFDETKEDSVPTYALFNSKNRKYFYTSDTEEKKKILTNSVWTDKGIAFWMPKENTEIIEVNEKSEETKVSYGPEISIGLWSYTKDNLKEEAFKIDANKDYVIKDSDGKKIAEISNDKTTKIKYISDKEFLIYDSIKETKIEKEIRFEAKDGNNQEIIFNVHRPSSSYDEYRGKIKIKYTDNNNIWVINTLPMEQYVWGMGETTGTGPFEHTKVMTVIFRTYGYWYQEYATKYLKYGFIIRSDSGSQIYRGHEWETKYPNIKKAAEKTAGTIVKYKDEIALTPYSSWTDGRTRSFKERWGSSDYPWCKSVKDPYGKHPTLSTKQLEAAGNHMVGMSANGSVKLAGEKYDKSYDWIIKYYYSGISLKKMY